MNPQNIQYHRLQQMLNQLNIPQIPFDYLDQTNIKICGGYCTQKGIAVNPLVITGNHEQDLTRVVFHECGHYLLGHARPTYMCYIEMSMNDYYTARFNAEIEAESVANRLLEIFKFPEHIIKQSDDYIKDYISKLYYLSGPPSTRINLVKDVSNQIAMVYDSSTLWRERYG